MHEVIPKLSECLKATFPPVTLRLMHEASREEPDFDRISEVISLDPGLSAAVLSMANSPFYSVSQRVEDIHRAAVTMGTRELLNIALSTSLVGALKDNSHKPETQFDNWRILVFGAMATRTLAELLCPDEGDKAFLTAMLKDLSLLLASVGPQGLRDDLGVGDVCGPLLCCNAGKEGPNNHGEISAALLRSFGLSLPADAITHHHNLEGLRSLTPLAQAVVLGQRWAEHALGCKDDPAAAMQFQIYLGGHLGLDQEEMEKLRLQCRDRYQALLFSLGIEETTSQPHSYQQSLPDMQRAYLLAMEVLHVRGGVEDVARLVCRQLRLHYGIVTMDLALKDSARGDYALFSSAQGDVFSVADRAANLDLLHWMLPDRGHPLFQEGRYLGELRIPLVDLNAEDLASVMMYTRHLSMSYDYYLERVAVVEMKARTLDTLPLGVARCDGSGNVLEANDALLDLLDVGDMRGRNVLDVLSRSLSATFDQEWKNFFVNEEEAREGSISHIFCDLLLAHTRNTPCVYISATRAVHADALEVVVLVQDVTELTDLEVQALRRLDFLNQLVSSMRELVLTITDDGFITYVSPSGPSEIKGENLFTLARSVDESMGPWGPQSLEESMGPVEVLLRLKNGSIRPYELAISAIKTPSGPSRYLVVGRDLTTIRRLEESLRRQAIYDGMTGLYNHEHLLSLLDRECRRSVRTGNALSVLFLDLDGFKEINDRQGHQAGDDILKTVGRILLDKTRRGTDFPCRYGGDEFAVLLAETGIEQAMVLAERLQAAFQEKFGGRPGASIGLACLRPGERPAELLGRVDQACYTAKSSGKNQIVSVD